MKEKINFDWVAGKYDEIYRTYKKDLMFYLDEASKTKGKILEIACGTGRIYLEILKKGKEIYGIDISKKMLNVLKEKAKKENLNPKVYLADMRNFKLKHKFDLIIIPFRSFLHNLTAEDQIRTLKNIKKHLTKKGKLVLNFFYPDPKVLANTKIKSKKQKKDTDYLVDIPNQIEEFSYGKLKYNLSFIYKKEFELLLRLAGFKKWKVYGGFKKQILKNFKQEMVWIVEK